jgi:hypothetical protein
MYNTVGSTIYPTTGNIFSILWPNQAIIKGVNIIKVEVILVVANRSTQQETVPVPLCPPQIPYRLNWGVNLGLCSDR